MKKLLRCLIALLAVTQTALASHIVESSSDFRTPMIQLFPNIGSEVRISGFVEGVSYFDKQEITLTDGQRTTRSSSFNPVMNLSIDLQERFHLGLQTSGASTHLSFQWDAIRGDRSKAAFSAMAGSEHTFGAGLLISRLVQSSGRLSFEGFAGAQARRVKTALTVINNSVDHPPTLHPKNSIEAMSLALNAFGGLDVDLILPSENSLNFYVLGGREQHFRTQVIHEAYAGADYSRGSGGWFYTIGAGMKFRIGSSKTAKETGNE